LRLHHGCLHIMVYDAWRRREWHYLKQRRTLLEKDEPLSDKRVEDGEPLVGVALRWLRLFEQNFRVVKWAPARFGAARLCCHAKGK
jgi:hypothetical protein